MSNIPIIKEIGETDEVKESDKVEDFDGIAESSEIIVEIINAFQTYFKKLFKKKDNENMFADIDIANPLSTNRSMEFLYDHIYKYKNNTPEYNKLYDETDEFELDHFDEFYTLMIDGEIIKLSASVYALINYLVTEKKEWYTLRWELINLKLN